MKMMGVQNKRFFWALGLILAAFLSAFVLANLSIVDRFSTGLIAELSEKQATVTALTAATAAASVGVGVIPGAGALSTNIADLGDYLLLVLGAIWLQKYLVSMTGFVTFKLLYPASALFLAGGLFWEKAELKQLATKLFLFGSLLFALVPTSIGISQHVEKMHDISVQKSLESLEESQAATTAETEEDEGWWDKLTGSVTSAVTGLAENAKTTFSNMVDSVAVLIITTCIIPVLVFLFFIWAVNLLFGLDLPTNLPKSRLLRKGTEKLRVIKKHE